ncbi:hypothetical protein CFE70_001098 [Pyrenophora teres f. teres 0-1]
MLPYEIHYNWAEYKKDTNYIAGYLLQKSKQCGFRRHVNAKNLKGYTIHHSEFASMAQLCTILARAIRYRREVTSWYRATRHGSIKDDQHDAFADCLQEALNILQPCMQRNMMPEQWNNPAKPSKRTPIDNLFDILKIHDTCDNDQDTGMNLEKMAHVPKVEVSTHDESNLEDEFWIEIKGFLKELELIRNYLIYIWLQDETDTITKAFVTNTAICIVRRKEAELETSLVLPAKYPAKTYPALCLPAMLLSKDTTVESFLQKQGHSIEMMVLTSPLILNTRALSEQGQEHARLCYYNVYNPLKFLACSLKQAPSVKGRPSLLIIKQDFPKLQAVHKEVQEAFRWAQALSVAAYELYCGFAIDEVTRGVRHLQDTHEVAIWITFGMQLHLDLQRALGDSIGDAFDEARKDISRFSIQKSQIPRCVQPTAAAHETYHYGNISKTVDSLKDFLLKDDKLVKAMYSLIPVEYQDTLEAEMSVFIKERHWFWRHNPILCEMINYNMTKTLRMVPLKMEEGTETLLAVVHLYNICRNLFPKDSYWLDMER